MFLFLALPVHAQVLNQPLINNAGLVFVPLSIDSERVLITYWSRYYHVPTIDMMAVAECESHALTGDGANLAFNPQDPHGGSRGLFQFQTRTFNETAKTLGLTASIWDADAQVHAAAYLFSKGDAHLWSCAKIMGVKDLEPLADYIP